MDNKELDEYIRDQIWELLESENISASENDIDAFLASPAYDIHDFIPDKDMWE